MTDPLQPRFRLPHWGWFLLPTIALVTTGVALSIWLPYHREQQIVRQIKSWDGCRHVKTETCGPDWLQKIVGQGRMREFKFFERVIQVRLARPPSDVEIAHLSGLTNLRHLYLDRTAVTDAGLAHLSELSNLKILVLQGKAVTDASIVQLSRLSNLEEIGLKATAVTDKGIEELHAALPSCRIWQ